MQAAAVSTRKTAGRSSRHAKEQQEAAAADEQEAAQPAADAKAAPSSKKKPGRASKAEKLPSEQEQAAQQVSTEYSVTLSSDACDALSATGAHVLGPCLQGD